MIAAATIASAFGQSDTWAASQALGPRAVVSLVTEAPGKELYLAWGHTALRVRDPDSNLDILFNFGTIDRAYLEDPTFIGRFLVGDLRYSLSATPFSEAAEYDRQTENRRWSEQVLNLSPEQVGRLFGYLRWNAEPKNREYQYDFIRDNCASRIPMILEKVLGPVFRYPQPDHSRAMPTTRDLIEAKLVDRPPWDLLVSLGLGSVADKVPTPREAAFLPDQLRLLYAQSRILQIGQWQPLVREEREILVPVGVATPPKATDLRWLLWVIAVGFAARTAWQFWKNSWEATRWGTLADRLLFAGAGAGGLLLAYLTLFSHHFAAQGNINLLWLWPTHLLMSCLPQSQFKKRWPRWYWLLSAVATGIAVAGWPWWPQRTLAAMVPIMAILSIRAFRWSRLTPSSLPRRPN